MSFRLFIYYCALSGGWAAFAVWAFARATGVFALPSPLLRSALVGGLLGAGVAAAVGAIDSLVNAASRRAVRSAACAGLGLAGGAVGGLVGHLLNDYLRVPLFVGWMLAGVLIGAAVGAFDVLQAASSGQGTAGSFRKMVNGVIGGLLGGLLGGLPFTFLAPRGGALLSPAAVSLIILGASIGLMIGLAQVVLKEAWIEVEEGFRPGRVLLLTRDETTIGRAETCDLGLFGDNAIGKVHARIVRDNDRYLLAHAADGGETLVNDDAVGDNPVALRAGDAIRVGRSVLRFGERQKRK
jgi:hypothetical protein